MKFDLSFALEILPALLRGAIVTAEATFGGMALALVGGLVLALGRRSRVPGLSRLSASYVLFMRNTPLLVQIYFLFYVLPFAGITFGALTTGILALGLNYSAYIAEVYRAGIDGVPQGQWEAARALDFSPRPDLDAGHPAPGFAADAAGAGQLSHRHVQGFALAGDHHGAGDVRRRRAYRRRDLSLQ
jgi:amine acid ABC transporter, permease protein, 3-TM region, His/Glu/Gln/Arg/opine family